MSPGPEGVEDAERGAGRGADGSQERKSDENADVSRARSHLLTPRGGDTSID